MSAGVRRFQGWAPGGLARPRSRQISVMISATGRPVRSASRSGASRRSRSSRVEVGGVGLGVAVVRVGGALDRVLDLTDDALAGGGAGGGRVGGGREGAVQAAGEGDAAADGAGNLVEGCGEADEGGCVWCRGLRWVRRDGGVCGGGRWPGCAGGGRSRRLLYEAVQDFAVGVRVAAGVGGVVLRGGLGLGRHEQNKNIVGGVGSRMVVRFTAGGMLELARHLFTWGAEVTILGPPELRTLMQEELRAALGRHLERRRRGGPGAWAVLADLDCRGVARLAITVLGGCVRLPGLRLGRCPGGGSPLAR